MLKLIDFGISKWIVNEEDTVLVDKDHQMGTLSYMAPESLKVNSSYQLYPSSQSSFVQMGTPADIWALGCILHEMMLGFLPFSQGIKSQKEKVTLIIDPELRVDIPERPSSPNEPWNYWRNLVLVCLSKNPSCRIKMPELLAKSCYPSQFCKKV